MPVDRVLSMQDSADILDLLAAFPHGAQAYNLALGSALVDLSINLARVRLQQGEFYLESSYRFFNEAQSLPLQQSVLALARIFALRSNRLLVIPAGNLIWTARCSLKVARCMSSCLGSRRQ